MKTSGIMALVIVVATIVLALEVTEARSASQSSEPEVWMPRFRVTALKERSIFVRLDTSACDIQVCRYTGDRRCYPVKASPTAGKLLSQDVIERRTIQGAYDFKSLGEIEKLLVFNALSGRTFVLEIGTGPDGELAGTLDAVPTGGP